ncbi:MAG: DNA-directed RNA polymerase subunit alpha [Patescibacteria group bacterium]
MELNIILPSKPRIIAEDAIRGSYEVDGLYPGYGHTLGNSLRRIALSSIIGTAITSLKIDGAPHEFSTLVGVKEDALAIILNLKKLRFKMSGDEPQTAQIEVKGVKTITGADITAGGQVEIINPQQTIATITDKNTNLKIELTLEKGVGYVSKEVLQQLRPAAIGTIILDASFTPIRRVNYEVENMRVGDRTDYNRLRFNIETDGTIAPREAFEKAIEIAINQLKAIIGFKEEEKIIEQVTAEAAAPSEMPPVEEAEKNKTPPDVDFLKTRVEDLKLSSRVIRVLTENGVRTIGGLTRKRESDLTDVSGLGERGIEEIKKLLKKHNLELKS